MGRIFSEQRTVEGWLEAERALAKARVGVLTHADAEAIAEAAVLRNRCCRNSPA